MGREESVIQTRPGVGVSMTANVGGDRQIVLQAWYPLDDKAEGDALLGELNLRVDRLQAPHELKKLREELGQNEEGLVNVQRNLAKLDENEQREQAARVIAQGEGEAAVAEADAKARSDWYKRKTGDYVPGNRIAQMQAALELMKARHREAAEKVASERAMAEEQIAANVRRFEREIAVRKGRIAELEALIGGG